MDDHRDEILVSLRGLDGADASRFIWVPPDGFEIVRPGVLAVENRLADGLAANKKKLDSDADVGRVTAPLTGSFTSLAGRIQCRSNGVSRPLPFVGMEVDGHRFNADAFGNFSLNGSFGTGRYTLRVLYDAPVKTSSVSTPLVVMDDVHQARSEIVTPSSAGTAGSLVQLGDVTLTGVDCEIFRLGALVLDEYQAATRESPPARKLRIKRWSAVWDGTPHTYALPPTNKAECGRKMVAVLQPNVGTIHTIRDFEIKYCALYGSGNPNCSGSTPARAAPAACPPAFTMTVRPVASRTSG